MKALILCGGLGKRLGDLTKEIPKPLIPIGNTTVIEQIVDRLRQHGITQVMVKVHYLPDKIMKVLGDKVIYYYEPILYSHFETIRRLRPWLDGEDFLVINGDTISDVSYTDMEQLHVHDTITALMDEWRCAGTWIYCKSYFDKNTSLVIPFRPKLVWHDIGTPERLAKAKEYYET